VNGYGTPRNAYPTVVTDETNATQANNPSIPAYNIYVPLPFWFTEEGQSLPLVGLQYYTVDVTIVLNPSQQLYTTRDSTPFGFQMAPGQSVDVTSPQNIIGTISGNTLTVSSGPALIVGTALSSSQSGFTSCIVTAANSPSYTLSRAQSAGTYTIQAGLLDSAKQAALQKNIPTYVPSPNTSNYEIRNFFSDINESVPPLNYWTLNPQIHTTYVFLPDSEREIFATKPLTYMMRQVTLVSFPEIVTSQLLNLDIHNPITRLILIPRRSDSLVYRNQSMNFTNWWDWPNRPSVQTQTSTSLIASSGISPVASNLQKDIIQFLRILADGNQLQEHKMTPFFTELTAFRSLSGGSNRGLPVYTFELHSPTFQPSGSLNSSRINRLQIELQINALASNANYIYGIDVYVENLNFFLVESGMGSPKYAS
jgi:hypothetical protein